jgi:hypothetical protein
MCGSLPLLLAALFQISAMQNISQDRCMDGKDIRLGSTGPMIDVCLLAYMQASEGGARARGGLKILGMGQVKRKIAAELMFLCT